MLRLMNIIEFDTRPHLVSRVGALFIGATLRSDGTPWDELQERSQGSKGCSEYGKSQFDNGAKYKRSVFPILMVLFLSIPSIGENTHNTKVVR